MLYKGHIEKGVVVLDDNVALKDGTAVRIELVETPQPARQTSLRDLPYAFPDPFSPVVSDSDWEANR